MQRRIKYALFAALGGCLVAGPCAAAGARPPTPDPTYGLPIPLRMAPPAAGAEAHWIWANPTSGHQVVLARRVLTLTRIPAQAQIAITADDSFALFVNGHLVDQSDGKEQGWKVVHRLSVGKYLTPGPNTVAIRAVDDGGAAGILARLEIDGKPRLQTGADWKVLKSENEPAGWNMVGFDDAAWPHATVEAALGEGPWGNGVEGWPGHSADAWYMAHKTLLPVKVGPASADPDGMRTTLVDFGQEYAGRLVLEGTAGAVITVRTGESLAECTHQEPALDNSGPTELALAGATPVTTRYSAFRYALIKSTQPITLTRITLDHKYYPVTYRGTFACSDPRLTRIWYIGAYTAHLCMQEDIWDAPKRDRGLWSGDLQVTGQTINTVFADRFLMEQSLRKLREIAQAGQPDTALPLHEINNIPGYTASWFCTLADFHRHQGDDRFLRSQHQKILSLLEFQKTDFNAQHLFANPRHDWAFCDWATGFVINTPPTLSTTDLYIIKGVREAVFLLQEMGDKANAQKYAAWADTLTAAARQSFADTHTMTYGDRLQQNAMAVYAGVATPAQQEAIYHKILATQSPAWQPEGSLTESTDEVMSPYYGYFVLSAYGTLDRNQDGLDLIRRYWGDMVKRGAVTWWEKFDPRYPRDFNKVLDSTPYLSLSHGWSSGPTGYLTEQILGIRPTAGGFRTVTIAPRLGDLRWAAGTVPTPRGPIHLTASRQAHGLTLRLTLPAHTDALIGVPGQTFRINGRTAKSDGHDGNTALHLTHAGAYLITVSD